MNRIVNILVVLSMTIVGLGTLASAPTEATSPLDTSQLKGRLAFPVFENGTYNIYTANIDGSERALLISEASQPDFNADGSQIAYRSWKTDQRGIFTTPVDNIIPWNIQGRSIAESGRPIWSPDGRVIAFQSYEEPDRKPRIYYTGGEGYLPIRTDKSGRYVDLIGIDPDWMLDGSIVYAEKECQDCGLFRISLTGGVVARLTTETADEAPAASPDGTRVAFMSTRDGVWDLYVVNANGTGLSRLTEDEDVDGLPIWAPDNKTLIFVSNRDGLWGLWAIDANTKAMAKLFDLGGELDGKVHAGTSRGWTEERITWAPPVVPPPTPMPGPATNLDTSYLKGRLAFPVFENDTYNIYTANMDGSDRKLLIPEASQPDFNADGSQIAYRSWKTDQRGLFSSPVDNIIPWSISRKAVAESARPVWSEDGDVIVFQSYEEPDRKPRIYHTSGDSYKTILTDKSGKYIDVFGIDPDWMPDGSIVYTEKECEKCGIYNISLQGGVIARLTDHPGDEGAAVSPEGKRVAFMSTRNGMWDLYVVNSDGTGLVQLTRDEYVDGLPIWAPDNKTVIFVSNRDGQWGIWAFDVDGYAMGKLFDLGGEIDGKIHEGTSRGWTEERISWAPPATPPPTPMPAPATNLDTSYLEGRLAFPVFENGTYNIYTANVDGSDRELLISEASQPDFNADGTQIAYRSWKTDQRGLFSTPLDRIIPWNIQGKAIVESGRPLWSDDGKVVLFHSYEEPDRKPRIYHTAGDSYKTILTDKSGKYIDVFGIDPDWMPDGSLVYTEKECEKCGIFHISLQGGIIGQLTDHPDDQGSAVSPDGKRVAFMSTRNGTWDLYVVNADGSGLQQLTSDVHVDGLPIWAPDNRTVIFVSNRDGRWALWAFDVDGYTMGKLFDLGGELDGTIHAGTSRGWTEERISWAP